MRHRREKWCKCRGCRRRVRFQFLHDKFLVSCHNGNMITYSDTKTLYGGDHALPLVIFQTDTVRAVVALQGAQLLEYRKDGVDYLWLSPKAIFQLGKSIRGGIPISAPWFGVNPDPLKVKHGFVRTTEWSVGEITGGLEFRFVHKGDEVFPYPFSLNYIMALENGLELSLTVENKGTKTMPYSWAWHSYHPVANLASVSVDGLEGIVYLDATQGFEKHLQSGPVRFEGEIDRVYENVGATQIIKGTPNLEITGENCPTAILWNPGATLAETLADVGGAYKEYICVERGAAFADFWELKPQEKRTSFLKIKNV